MVWQCLAWLCQGRMDKAWPGLIGQALGRPNFASLKKGQTEAKELNAENSISTYKYIFITRYIFIFYLR